MSLDVSPLLTDVTTLGSCPSMATADIYTRRAIVDKERKIKVTARDKDGGCFSDGGENVRGLLSLLGSGDLPRMGTTTDNGDGTYDVGFTPTTTGEHELQIMVNGQPIKGSPFIISVHRERDYQFLTGYQQQFGTSTFPSDVAIHDSGDLYVAAYGPSCIDVFTSSGTRKLSFGTQGNGQGQFYHPVGIALRGDVVYVTECGNHRVQKLSITGEHIAFIGEGQFRHPRGICLDSDHRVFVADHSNQRVQVFNADGNHAYSITGSSAEGSKLSAPWGVAFDRKGQLHVVDYVGKLVRVFTEEGKYVTTYGNGQFSYYPAGIAIDDEGYSFVTEFGSISSSRLHIFNPQHQLVDSTNPRACQQAGMAIDKGGSIWVADYNVSRLTQL